MPTAPRLRGIGGIKKACTCVQAFSFLAEQAGFEPAVGY
jgi:hypothetical protein